MSLPEAKAELRATIRARLLNISAAVRAVESIELCDRLRAQMSSAHTVLFYAPLGDELDVWPLLESSRALGATCALPCFDAGKGAYGARRIEKPATEVVPGKFDIREPDPDCPEIALDRFDLVLVPGLAFDWSGNRLGRGKGFYDKLLVKTSGVKCGVGYDFQLLEKIPAEPHDVRLDFIFTPSRCLKSKNGAYRKRFTRAGPCR